MVWTQFKHLIQKISLLEKLLSVAMHISVETIASTRNKHNTRLLYGRDFIMNRHVEGTISRELIILKTKSVTNFEFLILLSL